MLENSRDITGAFNSALAITDALKNRIVVEWVISSSVFDGITEKLANSGITFYKLRLLEIGRSWERILGYVPMLLVNAVRLRALLKHRNVDILIVNDYYNLLGAAVKASGWKGRLITYVRLLPRNQHSLLNNFWVWIAFKYSDAVIAVSAAVAKQLPRHRKLRVIYDPIGIVYERNKLRFQSKKESTTTVRFLYLSNYVNGKGHLTALEAFSKAYAEIENIHLRFVGSDMGIPKNKALKSALCAQIEKLGLTSVVEVVSPVADVVDEILSCNVILNFSESESFSRTCLEGSVYGKPVIATRCGGPEEIVDDHISGLLVPVSDVSAMKNAILSLAKDRLLRQQMGEAGAKIVQRRFTDLKFTTEFLEVIRAPVT